MMNFAGELVQRYCRWQGRFRLEQSKVWEKERETLVLF
jgi:hypothetical protein